jgi:glyoxylase-like metal-dependent hydrolase (beta-lactamase superfamily II)
LSQFTLSVLQCGHTTLDYELVATGHPDPAASRHLALRGGEPGGRPRIVHPVYAWVIRHPDATILVDTGMSATFDRDWKNDFYRDTLAYDPGDSGRLPQQLDRLGLKPEDFTDVVITHLHTDHAGNLPAFARTRARILVHEDELRGAVVEKGGLLRDDTLTLWGVTSPQGFTRRDFGCLLPDRATTVFGDQQIYRGVWTVSIPGHTWGTMGVAVKLPQTGWVLLASDHIYLAASYGDPFVGNILNQEPKTWARSALKVRRLVERYGMRVLPGHDNRVIAPDKDQGFVLEELQLAYE